MQPPSSPINFLSIHIDPGDSKIEEGLFAVDVTLKHPFPGLHQFNGFDVRGIMMSDGTLVREHDNSVIMSGDGETRLLNADGYTRFWNPTEFTSPGIFGFNPGKLAPPNSPSATVNGYKYFADGLGPEDAIESLNYENRGIFTTYGVNTRRYMIQFKMDGLKPVFDFNYAVDASWELPDQSYAPYFPPEAFPIKANVAEAFNFKMSDAGSTAYYENEDKKGGELILSVEIWDRQAEYNLSGVAGEIASIWLEGEVLHQPVNVLPMATVLPGSSTQSSVFEFMLADLNLTHSGTVQFFITVESAEPNTYMPQIDNGDTFIYPDSPLAAYFDGYAVISDTGPQIEDPPSGPILIDPNHPVYGTHFAIDPEGIIHALYTDGTDIFWSWSDDLGWNWNNEHSIYTVSEPNEIIRSTDLMMDARDDYVYALFCQWDGNYGTPYCEMFATRMNITDYSAGWETLSVWRRTTGSDNRQNYHGPQMTVLSDGSIMVYAMRYYGTGGFEPTYFYAPTWSALENAPEIFLDTRITNGYTVYTYPKSAIAMVHDSSEEIFHAIGGYFFDHNSDNGTGADFGNAILKYDKATDMWTFIQTSHHQGSNMYWDTAARGLAIDKDDYFHWVFQYSYDNCGPYGDDGGYWALAYGTAPSSADHTDIYYDDPIDANHLYYIPCPGYTNGHYDAEWRDTSIGADLDGNVVIAYTRSVNDCNVYCIRNDGAGWTDPPVEVDEDLFGYNPFGRMHGTGWYMITFTDRDYFNNGSMLPYFVAWK